MSGVKKSRALFLALPAAIFAAGMFLLLPNPLLDRLFSSAVSRWSGVPVKARGVRWAYPLAFHFNEAALAVPGIGFQVLSKKGTLAWAPQPLGQAQRFRFVFDNLIRTGDPPDAGLSARGGLLLDQGRMTKLHAVLRLSNKSLARVPENWLSGMRTHDGSHRLRLIFTGRQWAVWGDKNPLFTLSWSPAKRG